MKAYSKARADAPVAFSRPAPVHAKDRPNPHPSASTPSFASLAIFTGEEERFSFARAVSRVHEMSSAEYLVSATHSPLARELRTWEKAATPAPAAKAGEKSAQPAGVMGEKVGFEEGEKVSGVLPPDEIRLRWPGGLPPTEKEVEVRGGKDGKPVIKETHAWGVVDSWGKKAGRWGQGAKAYEGEEKK